LVVPVPVYWWKRLRRGVHGPDVLVEAVGAALQLPTAFGFLYCRRPTRKQGTLLPAERFANVRGAFAVRPCFDIADAHILLIDDIMTTGATGSEAAKVLRQAGAARVTLAVVARGVGQDRRGV
jgi:predicted amidophosphoribosyltransferase